MTAAPAKTSPRVVLLAFAIGALLRWSGLTTNSLIPTKNCGGDGPEEGGVTVNRASTSRLAHSKMRRAGAEAGDLPRVIDYASMWEGSIGAQMQTGAPGRRVE
jgi:hypothetical protein